MDSSFHSNFYFFPRDISDYFLFCYVLRDVKIIIKKIIERRVDSTASHPRNFVDPSSAAFLFKDVWTTKFKSLKYICKETNLGSFNSN